MNDLDQGQDQGQDQDRSRHWSRILRNILSQGFTKTLKYLIYQGCYPGNLIQLWVQNQPGEIPEMMIPEEEIRYGNRTGPINYWRRAFRSRYLMAWTATPRETTCNQINPPDQ